VISNGEKATYDLAIFPIFPRNSVNRPTRVSALGKCYVCALVLTIWEFLSPRGDCERNAFLIGKN
jgi:hypothetical protein